MPPGQPACFAFLKADGQDTAGFRSVPTCCAVLCVSLVQVAVLFRSHNDLLTQFTYFLPDNSPPQVR
jgi:hypothetical protein